jgi:tetratricopeptide (TPR) repeat protein
VVGRGGQDPERARVLLAKGRISLKSKRFAAAAAEFASAAIADPSLFEARLLTHWAEYLADPDEAAPSVAALQALAKVRDANAELWGFLGRMYLNSGDEERARKCFEKAIKMDPDHVDSRRQLRLLVKRSSAAGDGSKKSFWNRLRGK